MSPTMTGVRVVEDLGAAPRLGDSTGEEHGRPTSRPRLET